MHTDVTNYIKNLIPVQIKKGIYKLGRHFCTNLLKLEAKRKPRYWDVYPDDVFLVSYPRSGNTWMRYLMTNLRFPDADWNLSSLIYVFPEIYSSIDPSCAPTPRWIKSHDRYTPAYPKVIYLVRDGRDVAVSFYHWSGYSNKCTFDDYVKNWILNDDQGHFMWGAWHTHVKDWLDHADTSNCLIVQYEKLVASPIIEIQRIAKFVELERTISDIEIAVERSSFKKQQSDFQQHEFFAKDPMKKQVGVKGGQGKWKEFFSEKLLREFWEIAGEFMESVGYEYNYKIPNPTFRCRD